MASQRPFARPKRAGEEFARTHIRGSDGDNTGNDIGGPSAKKPRFDVRNPSALAPDAIEDDAVLDADEIGRRGQQVKRNAVNIDGFDSDSSNEGFDARADVKARQRKGAGGARSKDEEDHDMFADLEEGAGADGDDDEELTREGKKKSKNVRFLGSEEILGQVASSKSGGHVSSDFSLSTSGGRSGGSHSSAEASRFSNLTAAQIADENAATKDGNGLVNGDGGEEQDDDDEDVAEAERAAVGSDSDASEVGAGSKKHNAPLLDAFNMRTEQEEGRFDDQGNYVRKAADPDAVHDTWLEGVSKKDMRRAKEAAEKRDEEERQRRLDEDSILTSDILKRLIPLLERGETPLEALARLGKGKSRGKANEKKKAKWQAKKGRSEPSARMDVDMETKSNGQIRKAQADGLKSDHNGQEDANTDPAESKRLSTIDTLTTSTSLLLSRDNPEIYSMERELLTRMYKRETGEEWVERTEREEKDIEMDSEGESPMAQRKGLNGHPHTTQPPLSSSNKQASKWEYKWADGRDGPNQIHGPYEGEMMRSWCSAGYFGDVSRDGAGGEGILVRETVTTAPAGKVIGGRWKRVADVDFSA